MNAELEKSLKQIKNSGQSELQKIHAFYDLCKAHELETIILRLSGEIKNRLLNTIYLITFTTKRVIISKKRTFQRIIDMGYIAGLGPILYYIISDKVKIDDVSFNNSIITKRYLSNKNHEYIINYEEIDKSVFYHGIETIVSNMFGSAVKENLLKIYTKKHSYIFTIPSSKNGEYEKIFYWMNLALPFTLSDK